MYEHTRTASSMDQMKMLENMSAQQQMPSPISNKEKITEQIISKLSVIRDRSINNFELVTGISNRLIGPLVAEGKIENIRDDGGNATSEILALLSEISKIQDETNTIIAQLDRI